MTSLSTRIASLVLAFGFFISCSPGIQTIEEKIEGASPEELLETATNRLSGQPDDPAAHHMAGYAHYRLASDNPVSARQTHYRSMTQSFNQALDRYSASLDREAIRHLSRTISDAWNAEFIAGTRLLEAQIAPSVARLDTIIWHARNATEIGPDSLSAFVFLSDVYLKQNSYVNAADAMMAVERFETSLAGKHFERLAYLLTRNGEYGQASRWYIAAIDWMETGQNLSLQASGNPTGRGTLLNVYHGAVNTLLESGQTDTAIYYLEKLADTLQDNASYNELLILQYFNQIRSSELDEFGGITLDNLQYYYDKSRDITERNPHFILLTSAELIDLLSVHVDLRREFDEAYEPMADEIAIYLSEQAVALLTSAHESDPENEEPVYALATVYALMEDETNAAVWNNLLD